MQRQSGEVEYCNSEERRYIQYIGPEFFVNVHFQLVHPKELHHKNIPEKLYKAFDRIRQTVSGYRPGKSRNHLTVFKSGANYTRAKMVNTEPKNQAIDWEKTLCTRNGN